MAFRQIRDNITETTQDTDILTMERRLTGNIIHVLSN